MHLHCPRRAGVVAGSTPLAPHRVHRDLALTVADRAEAADGDAELAVAAEVSVGLRHLATNEVLAFEFLGAEEKLQVGRINVGVGNYQAVAARGQVSDRGRDAGLPGAALAAE